MVVIVNVLPIATMDFEHGRDIDFIHGRQSVDIGKSLNTDRTESGRLTLDVDGSGRDKERKRSEQKELHGKKRKLGK